MKGSDIVGWTFSILAYLAILSFLIFIIFGTWYVIMKEMIMGLI